MINYKQEVLTIGSTYFGRINGASIDWSHIHSSTLPFSNEVVAVELPVWAKKIGVGINNIIIIPKHCIKSNSKSWKDVDWWRAAYDLLTMKIECDFEEKNGPIHSYSTRLIKISKNLFDRAWVNRIFIFLRKLLAWQVKVDEAVIFKPLPRARLYLTHDIDYVKKTIALRFKQVIFTTYNIFKSLLDGNPKNALKNIYNLGRFSILPGNYWQFSKIVDLENSYDIKSTWNFYAGVGGYKRSWSELLFDPAYKIKDKRLTQQIKKLSEQGNNIGLHQGFHSWQDTQRMRLERNRLEDVLGYEPHICRQHWLRFSLAETWKAQEEAGFKLDTTLGFNDRPGFRNSAALLLPAWFTIEQRFSNQLKTLPMILMDSHLFDYNLMNSKQRRETIDYILDEILFVGGTATVIWHQRVFHSDYGWGDDYRYLLEGIKKRKIQT